MKTQIQRLIRSFLRWLEVEKGYSPHTVSGYGRDLTEFVAGLPEGLKASGLEAIHIRRFVVSLYGRNSAATVARKLSAIRLFVKYLLRGKHISCDLVEGITGPKVGKYLPVFLTVDEVFALLEGPAEQDRFMLRDRAILELLYSTGIRVAELVSRDTVSLDFETEMLRVRGKGNKERLVPVGPVALEAVRAWFPLRDQLIIARIREDLAKMVRPFSSMDGGASHCKECGTNGEVLW